MAEIEVPGGFVDFAMKMMQRAIKLRSEGITRERAEAFYVRNDDADPLTVAAMALLMSVEDGPVIDASARDVDLRAMPATFDEFAKGASGRLGSRVDPASQPFPMQEGEEIELPKTGKKH